MSALGYDPDDFGGLNVDDLDATERDLLKVFIAAHPESLSAAVEAAADYFERLEASVGRQPEADEAVDLTDEQVVEWLAARPHVVQRFDEFKPLLAHTSDLDEAEAMLADKDAQTKAAAARAGVGAPRDFDEAFDQARAEGMLGGPPQRYVHKRGGYEDDLGDAIGQHMEEVSLKQGLERQADERVKAMIRNQESRGRG